MIYIKETDSKKVSGLTSLSITFPYNRKVIEGIKSSEKYTYDAETKSWEVPISSLSYILDTLTFFDDIKLELMQSYDYYLSDIEKASLDIPSWFLDLDSKINDELTNE